MKKNNKESYFVDDRFHIPQRLRDMSLDEIQAEIDKLEAEHKNKKSKKSKSTQK